MEVKPRCSQQVNAPLRTVTKNERVPPHTSKDNAHQKKMWNGCGGKAQQRRSSKDKHHEEHWIQSEDLHMVMPSGHRRSPQRRGTQECYSANGRRKYQRNSGRAQSAPSGGTTPAQEESAPKKYPWTQAIWRTRQRGVEVTEEWSSCHVSSEKEWRKIVATISAQKERKVLS